MKIKLIGYHGPKHHSKDITIGYVYEVLEDVGNNWYLVKDDKGDDHTVLKTDCVIVEEETKDYSYPPVGTVCEYSLGGSPSWFECEIKYYLKDFCGKIYLVVFYNKQRGDQVDKIENIRFRPIKSEEDKAVEEMISEHPVGFTRDEIEGVRSLCRVLYNAGYRKTK